MKVKYTLWLICYKGKDYGIHQSFAIGKNHIAIMVDQRTIASYTLSKVYTLTKTSAFMLLKDALREESLKE